VSNFRFSTDFDTYLFYQPAATKFHIADYNKAIQDMNAYIALLKQYGFTRVVYNSVWGVYNYFMPDKDHPENEGLTSLSYISISALDKVDSVNYSGVFEIRCQLYKSEFSEE
jgi:hypothetical protein